MANTSTADAAATNATAGADLPAALTSALGAADTTAAQRVATLGLVHQARLSQLTRTAARATKQYGAGSPQAAAAQTTVDAAKTTIARIAVVNQQITTPAPQVAAGGWALHGRVFSAALQPLSGHCVFLVDQQNAYQSAHGFSYTDATGYFLLSYAGSPATTQTPGKQDDTASQNADQAPTSLFVEVVNPKGQPVLISTTPFQPATGVATYQNITLPQGEPPIGDPPAEIHKIAFPDG
jgi:hypothetical protein